jgi:hypothetical protein
MRRVLVLFTVIALSWAVPTKNNTDDHIVVFHATPTTAPSTRERDTTEQDMDVFRVSFDDMTMLEIPCPGPKEETLPVWPDVLESENLEHLTNRATGK